MAKIGIFYGSSTGNTEIIAEKLAKLFGSDVELNNIDIVEKKDIEKYDYLIFGTSTWGVGDMQDDWEDFIEVLSEVDFNKKKVALFGVGDQVNYPESFVDGMGVIYDVIYENVDVVGAWPLDGYTFKESAAVKNGKFVGLALDKENQQNLTDERLKKWVAILKKEFV
ncbi:MAG: flavodoxin [Bacteroidales bacterium]|nr:flavodoxin [Bacteroidales bacterium]